MTTYLDAGRSANFIIDIETSNGTKVGSGPITTALYWRQTYSLDRAGTFECEVPLSDPILSEGNIQERFILRCKQMSSPLGYRDIGSGRIDSFHYRPGKRGGTVVIKGMDLLAELADVSVQFLTLGSTATVTHSTAVSAVEAYAPSGWSFNADGSPPVSDIIWRFAGESVLAALGVLAQTHRTHFYLSDTREVTFVSSFADSAYIAVSAPAHGALVNSTQTVAYITDFSYRREANDIISRIYPYGGWYDGISTDFFIGIGDVNLGLTEGVDPEYWSSSPITGITHDLVNNYVEKTSTAFNYGDIQRQVQYPEIKVTFFTGGYSDSVWRDLNRLIYYKAVNELLTHDRVAEYYTLKVSGILNPILPAQTIRVILPHIEENGLLLNINEDLIILESVYEVTQFGASTISLTVSNVETYRRQDPFVTVRFRNRHFNDQYT